jgi:hypothetical protein
VHKNEPLLEHQVKSKESLQPKLRSSVKATRQGITLSPKEHIDIEIFDQWVDNLDAPTEQAYRAFCAENFSVIECYLYARFLRYSGCITGCDLWLQHNYPKPDHRKVLINEIEAMQEDIRKLREDIDNGVVKRDSGVARIASMQKELRGTIAQIDLFTGNKDRKGLLMAGADRAIRELLTIFKDDPIEVPLEEASMSVWSHMQMEE